MKHLFHLLFLAYAQQIYGNLLGDQAAQERRPYLYDRQYSLNPIPIHPRSTPPPSFCKKLQQEKRFEGQIQAYLKHDKIMPPQKGQVLFLGGSVISEWKNLKKQMSPLKVLCRAFGGARTEDLLVRTEQIILPYQPHIIVYYGGSNDLALGNSPEEVYENIKAFSDRIRAYLPKTKIVFLAIHQAPGAALLLDEIQSANKKIELLCKGSPQRIYLDLHDRLSPSASLFYQEDQLHLTELGYEEMASQIKPVLTTESFLSKTF